MTNRISSKDRGTETTQRVLKRLLDMCDQAHTEENNAIKHKINADSQLKRFLATNGLCDCLEIRFDKVEQALKL